MSEASDRTEQHVWTQPELQCKDCRHCRKAPGIKELYSHDLCCHRFPATVFLLPDDSAGNNPLKVRAHAFWPPVAKNDTCGEWEALKK